MRCLWCHHRQRPFLLPQLRDQALNPQPARALGRRLALLLALILLVVALLPRSVAAAELLQVRQATLLQIGDGNRSLAVHLACLQVAPDQTQAAEAWLRRELPRRSRVNLRPIGSRDGQLLALITRLGDSEDLGSRLIAAGLAQADPHPPACAALNPAAAAPVSAPPA